MSQGKNIGLWVLATVFAALIVILGWLVFELAVLLGMNFGWTTLIWGPMFALLVVVVKKMLEE